MRKIIALTCFAAAVLICTAAEASAPSFLPVQGYLTRADGTPVNGETSIQFAIVDTEAGGTALWSETQSLLVENGLLTAYLGEVVPLDLDIFSDYTDLWLAIQVGAEIGEQRIYLGSMPYTAYAEHCGNVPDISSLQARVIETCPSGSAISAILADGSILCEEDDDTTYGGADFARSNQLCPGAQKAVGIDASGTIVCAEGGLYTAGAGLNLTGTEFSLQTTFQTGEAFDGRFVNVSGDVMTGVLTLPDNGLVVGAGQLVVSGGNVGINTAMPAQALDVGGTVRARAFEDGDNTAYTADPAGTSLLNLIVTDGGIRFNTTADRPECNAGNRGLVWYTQGDTDVLEVCMNMDGSYAWKLLAGEEVVTGATYTDTFTSGVAPSAAQCTNWNSFRASLTGAYSSVTIKGTYDTVGVTCTGATANTICQTLRVGGGGSWSCGGRTWQTGTCGGIELSAAGSICSCPNPDYLVRPCIGNENWGGANTATCAGPTQTLTVVCGE
ncbi:MAG: hypothetical protein ABIJ56_20280 [Pseudomonadota bacterium]